MKLRVVRFPQKDCNYFMEFFDGDPLLSEISSSYSNYRRIFVWHQRVYSEDKLGRISQSADNLPPGLLVCVDDDWRLHCDDGPAIKSPYNNFKHWYLHGRKVTGMEVFEQLTPEKKEQAIWELDQWR